MFTTKNLTARVLQRQILSPAPGTSVHCARQFYENLVPNYTIYDIDHPDHHFRKFTDDGLYLITFSRNHQDLIVYRPLWPSYSYSGDDSGSHLPPKANKLDSYFTLLYTLPLASCNEFICKDFFLYLENQQFGLFATSSAPQEAPATDGAIQGVPSMEKITFRLVRLRDGIVLGEKPFFKDFINLVHNTGVFLYDDLLAILSLRYQTIHILQIRDSGSLVHVRAIGAYCREDDELFLNSYAKYMESPQNMESPGRSFQGQSSSGIQDENGQNQYTDPHGGGLFLSGIKQRMLSFIFRRIWTEETNHTLRVQSLKKKFYFHFQDYVDLIMWKVQFLDRQHLLIKFGSTDGGVSRNVDHHPAFFAVYNMETTEMIAFYQNSAEELYYLFEQFYDHFNVCSRNSLHVNFISSYANNGHALELLRSNENKASSFSQFVKKTTALLPFSCQSQSPSPYFDQSLFRFDEKLISAVDRHRQSTEHPIKFIMRRPPYHLKFKIKPGPEVGGTESRAKKLSSFLFHPFLPLALSIQQTFGQPRVVNIHFRHCKIE